MPVNAYELSAGLFIRGLTNLKTQLVKAEAHAAAGGGEAPLLNARLGADARVAAAASHSPADVHSFTLAAQVHWAAEGATLAIAQLLGAPRKPAAADAKSFAELQQRLDAAIAHFRSISPSDLEAGLERTLVMDQRRGSVQASGGHFLTAFAIPHFLYHLTAAYSILREQGVPLTMGDFLGNWAAS